MRCDDVECRLLELIEGELPPAQRAEVLTHLHDCATCTVEFSAYHDLLALVRVDPVPEPSPDFWEEFLPSLKHRIEQETLTHQSKPTSPAWLAGVGSWFTFRPRLIAGLAVAAVSIFVIVRLPGFLPGRTDRQAAPVSTEKVVGQNGAARNAAMLPRPDDGNHQSGEPLMVAGEVVEEPSTLVAAIQRLRWVDEIADRLETAWVLRPETDPSDSLASLDEKERQVVLDHLSHLQWSAS
ncbi:MAG: zf-HC2 domain-containing protein [candidate division NC10 bacterium]|nr:zf-HC2 domain-containing protein [candidate division NC10 bacterium]MDE2322269.1 zf-HC2 domain-containing protein [candidate division NC10 bacterium]